MIPKRFENIEFSDIQALLVNQVAEGKTIEYKREIPTNADSDKVKFLAGVSAFANTIGGDFIIGIEAVNGVPVSLPGANFADADAEILKLEQMLQNGLEQRLPSVSIKDIVSPTGEKFILVKANRSWIAPHKVKANEKFYGRNSRGKYPLDVSELRTAFMLNEQLTDRIRNFRAERIRKIKENDELPAELLNGGKVVLHLIPLSAFSTETEIDVINNKLIQQALPPLNGMAWRSGINLDGFLTYALSNSNRSLSESYSQIFRNGIVEAVTLLNSFGREEIVSHSLEESLIRCLAKYLKIISYSELEMPVYICLSFIGIKDFSLLHFSDLESRQVKLDRQDLILPEKVITSTDTQPAESLRPVFNLFWNAFGYARCGNFDEDGKWKE